MGRHKLTKTQAKLTGADKKNPARYNTKDPKVNPIVGAPPTHLTNDQVKAWKEILSAVPEGVAAKSDRIMLELSACLLSQLRAEGSEFPSSKQNSLISCLSKFGLNPVDRQKLGISPQDPDDDGWRDL